MAKIIRRSEYVIMTGPALGDGEDAPALYFTRHVREAAAGIHLQKALEMYEDKNIDLAVCDEPFSKYAGMADMLEYGFGGQHKDVRPGQLWRHFKTGKIVEVIAVAQNTECPGTFNVVYKHKDEAGHENIWCRPLNMFLSKVDREKYPDAKQEYRFELVVDAELKAELEWSHLCHTGTVPFEEWIYLKEANNYVQFVKKQIGHDMVKELIDGGYIRFEESEANPVDGKVIMAHLYAGRKRE